MEEAFVLGNETYTEKDVILVPVVISATDSASLANQVGLYRIANKCKDIPATYLNNPDGGFFAIIETYKPATKILKGEL